MAQMLPGPAQKGVGEVQTVAGAGAPTGGAAAAVPAAQHTSSCAQLKSLLAAADQWSNALLGMALPKSSQTALQLPHLWLQLVGKAFDVSCAIQSWVLWCAKHCVSSIAFISVQAVVLFADKVRRRLLLSQG